MRLNKALSVVIAVGLWSGCDDTECGEGTELRDDRCVVAEDRSDGGAFDGSVTCGAGTVLDDGECVPANVKKPIGSACMASSECESGTCIPPSEDRPGGFCTILSCGMDTPCPLGSTCYRLNISTTLCMNYCDRDTQCREDYYCQPLYSTDLNVCAPSCAVTNACLAGTRCNTESGLCELAECEVGASSGCQDQETCIADPEGLSSTGGLCLHLCDPAKPAETCAVDSGDVCQPMANDATMGFCTPPVCSSTPECPAGADCEAGKCMPPPACDGVTPCADDRTCVTGKCMRKCPSDGACSDSHPNLVCADALPTPACLPLGSYPGSECRPGSTDRCDNLGDKPMVCQDNICLADCSSGGDTLCNGLSPNLQCARSIYPTDVCLPRGSFPGSGCGANNTCAQDLYDNEDVDMKCSDGVCVVDCSEDGKWDGYGDALCALVDPTLTCTSRAGSICVRACNGGGCIEGYSCFDPGLVPDHENACLPNGSFPGGPCDATNACAENVGGAEDRDMTCVRGQCAVICDNNDGLCSGVDSTLTCAESVKVTVPDSPTPKNVCVAACGAGGTCSDGSSCLEPGAAPNENACLPNGSFPGSLCGANNACDSDVGGNMNVDMTCISGRCVVMCADNSDSLCTTVNPALTCAESANPDVCVPACDGSGMCPTGLSCLKPGVGNENACLPDGTFPGSACRTGSMCDQGLTCSTGNVCWPTCAASDPMCAVGSTCMSGACVPNP